MLVGIGANDHHRVGAERALPRRPLVGPEDEDGARIRHEEAVLGRECRVRTRVEALVGVLDAASKREVAQERPHEDDQDRDEQEHDADPKPAPAAARATGLPAAVRIRAVRPLAPLLARDVAWGVAGHRALGPPAPVDAVRLVLGGHSDRVS